MVTQSVPKNSMFVVLPAEPQISIELNRINEIVSKKCDFDVIIDFSSVEILTSSSIANLLILQDWLRGSGHDLILCNVSLATKSVFLTSGLDTFFSFANDRFAALAATEHVDTQHY